MPGRYPAAGIATISNHIWFFKGQCPLVAGCRRFCNDASGMSICPGKVRRRESGPRTIEAQPLAKSYFLPDLPPPGREAVRTPRANGKAPGRGPTARIQGLSGPAARGSGTGTPKNRWERVDPSPVCLTRPVPAAFPVQGSGLVADDEKPGQWSSTCLRFFRRMHLARPNAQVGAGSQEREEGQSPTTA